MSTEEAKRLTVIKQVIAKQITQRCAAELIDLITQLYRKQYRDSNFSHFTDKLQDIHQLTVSRPTVSVCSLQLVSLAAESMHRKIGTNGCQSGLKKLADY